MSGSGSDQPKRKPAAPPETRPRGGRTEVGRVPTLACQRLPGRRGRRLSEAGAAQWRRGKAHTIFSFNRKGEKWTRTQGPALLCPAPEQRDRSREVAMALQGWGKVRNLEAPPSAVGGGVPIRRKHVRGPRVSTQADWRRSPRCNPAEQTRRGGCCFQCSTDVNLQGT